MSPPKERAPRRAEDGPPPEAKRTFPPRWKGAFTVPIAIPAGLTIITDVLQVLPRWAGHHNGLVGPTCRLAITKRGSKGVMMARLPDQFSAVVGNDGQAGWPSYPILRYDGQHT